jgi:hypothetical protein
MFYLLISEFCEIRVAGPYSSHDERNMAAKQLHKTLSEDGFIWWMDTDSNIPNVGSYSNYFMNED